MPHNDIRSSVTVTLRVSRAASAFFRNFASYPLHAAQRSGPLGQEICDIVLWILLSPKRTD